MLLRRPIPTLPRFLGGPLAALVLAGCAHDPGSTAQHGDPGAGLSPANRLQAEGALAAVEIHGQTLDTVRETVESVFTEAGLVLVQRSPTHLVFDRLSSMGERAAYGDWFEGDTRVRFHVDLVRQDQQQIFVKCRSVIARDANSFAPDEQPLSRRRVRKYEPLLRDVAQRLN